MDFLDGFLVAGGDGVQFLQVAAEEGAEGFHLFLKIGDGYLVEGGAFFWRNWRV